MDQPENDAAATSEDSLNELLDSCLNDFNKPLPKAASSTTDSSSKSANQEVKATNSGAKMPDSTAWSEEFKQFSDVMENFMEDEGELGELRKWMGSLAESNPSVGVDDNFAQSFAETIRGLTEQAQVIPEPTAEELSSLFSGFDLGDSNQPDGEIPELMPLMQNVMQRLMSKELLYPSLKEIVEKYPDWLKEKQSSLEQQDYQRYNRQYELMKEVCNEFERSRDSTEDSKKEQFETVLQLMQKIQSCGNPPKELVSDVGHGVPLDEHGNLQIPGMPQQCVMM